MRPTAWQRANFECGHARVAVLGALFVLMLGSSALLQLGNALAGKGRVQRAADLAALFQG